MMEEIGYINWLTKPQGPVTLVSPKASIVLALKYIEWRFNSSDMRLAKTVKFSSVKSDYLFALDE